MTDEELEEIRRRFLAIRRPFGRPGWKLNIQPQYAFSESDLIDSMRFATRDTMDYVDISLELMDGTPVLQVEHGKRYVIGTPGLAFLLRAPLDVEALLREVDRLREDLEAKQEHILALEGEISQLYESI